MPEQSDSPPRLALPREPLIVLTCAGAVVAVQPLCDLAVRRGVPVWLSDVGDRLEELGIGSTPVQSVLNAVLVDVSPDRG